MKKMTMLLLVSMLGLAGCASTGTHSNGIAYARPSCPGGTTMICEVNSLRGCQCGQLIVLN
jgi:hypothetical protein